MAGFGGYGFQGAEKGGECMWSKTTNANGTMSGTILEEAGDWGVALGPLNPWVPSKLISPRVQPPQVHRMFWKSAGVGKGVRAAQARLQHTHGPWTFLGPGEPYGAVARSVDTGDRLGSNPSRMDRSSCLHGHFGGTGRGECKCAM